MAEAGPSSSTPPGRTIGCIGKCTSGLSLEELDRITDHVQHTLTHPQGRKIFKKYLSMGRKQTDLACLDLYETCTESVERERNKRQTKKPSIEQLRNDLEIVACKCEELDDVPQIDVALLERYSEALDSDSREAMLEALEETKTRVMNHLRRAHTGFRAYAMAPCPRSPKHSHQ